MPEKIKPKIKPKEELSKQELSDEEIVNDGEVLEAIQALFSSQIKPELDKIVESCKEDAPTDPVKRLPDTITSSIESSTSMNRSITEWRPILSKECQVYVIDQQYIAKRFDQVHYKYMGVDEAKEILTDNLYAILLYKYFPKIDDEALNRIDEIVRSLTRNIKTFLTKISFEGSESYLKGLAIKRVPNSAVAFANGIFDFIKNEFIVKYEKIYIPAINNTIILYNNYIIEWNFDFDFEPLPIKITETSFKEFVSIMKSLNKENRNYCWELFYNMTHDAVHRPSFTRMTHLAQILGYTLFPQFLQYFILLIGSGQNGKNSLFDGCFSSKVVPKPVSNSIESIEKDKFITGSLENACHNIFLETSPKTYTDSNMLKALTGSMYQTIENKGIGKYSGIINCKYIFAGNDQRNIKFSDTTTGFRRRINIFEIYYSWDSEHRFMKHGDYYQTDFSGDLHEIKEDITNTICYIYLGMYGILSATKNFTSDFKFSYNEWTDAYSDIDAGMKEYFNDIILPEDYFSIWGNRHILDENHLKIAFFDDRGTTRLYLTHFMKGKTGTGDFDTCVKYFIDSTEYPIIDTDGNESSIVEPNMQQYFKDKDAYVSLVYLRALFMKNTAFMGSQREFNDMFKKIYPNASYMLCAQRENYVRIRLVNNKIRFVEA